LYFYFRKDQEMFVYYNIIGILLLIIIIVVIMIILKKNNKKINKKEKLVYKEYIKKDIEKPNELEEKKTFNQSIPLTAINIDDETKLYNIE
jgi:predicted membrane protein